MEGNYLFSVDFIKISILMQHILLYLFHYTLSGNNLIFFTEA